MTRLTRALALTGMAIVLLPGTISSQGKLDPKAVQFQNPEEIKFVRNAAGTQETAVLFGDPDKPGPYVVRLRWLPGPLAAWGRSRTLPGVAEQTFREWWEARERGA